MINENANPAIPTQLPVGSSHSSVLFGQVSRDLAKQPKLQVSRLQLLVVAGLVVATDLLLYQGDGGLAGWAAWCLATLALLMAGVVCSKPVTYNHTLLFVGLSILITAARLLWQGSVGLVLISVLQLSLFALLLHSVPLSISTLIGFLLRWLPQGCRCLPPSLFSSSGLGIHQWRWLEFGTPLVITSLFATIFLLANPDAVSQFVSWSRDVVSFAENWLRCLRPGQPLVWIVVVVLGLGLIVPPWKDRLAKYGLQLQRPANLTQDTLQNPRVHAASRNTLFAVIVLFVLYLVVEFSTMWFREFPEGFHYSGYAHAGAAWLTVALALSTIVVSTVCRPSNFGSTGYATLLSLSRVWSFLNLALAICVFNRLAIYIDYNGMTRMRVVAILGVSCVVVGFALVMLKSMRGLSFSWLVDRQLTTLALFVYLLSVLPVDWLVYTYNCRMVLDGKQSPAVQITEHYLSSSALQAILPLTNSEDPVIAQGVAALVAQRIEEIAKVDKWQHRQLADQNLHRSVLRTPNAAVLRLVDQPQTRDAAIDDFKQHVWKWY